jgi:hypothetical protein
VEGEVLNIIWAHTSSMYSEMVCNSVQQIDRVSHHLYSYHTE